MPAVKTSLRFLALGACADVATAFGTISKVGEVVEVETEAAGGAFCPCDNYWYCQISGQGSLGQPSSTSYTTDVLTKSVSRCWNYCFKDSKYLDASQWVVPPGASTCPACERENPKGAWGCECKSEADRFSDCNVKDADGSSQADIWHTGLCSPTKQPGGTWFNAVGESFKKILPNITVTAVVGGIKYSENVNYNPFQQYERSLNPNFPGPSPFTASPCVQRGAVAGDADVDASVACAGVLKNFSKDVEAPEGCAAASSADCSSLYYYGDSWTYYCKDDYDAFSNFCKSLSQEECGTEDDVKHFVLNEYGAYNICYLKGGTKCRMMWTGSTTKPTTGAALCMASDPAGGDDDGTSAFSTLPSVCKQMLCGDGQVTGARPDDDSCKLYG